MKQFILAVLLMVAVGQAAQINVARIGRELLPVPVAIIRQSQVAHDDGSFQYG